MEFGLETSDVTGTRGSDLLRHVGEFYQHSGNHKFYEVRGVAWLCDTDTWGITHVEVDANGNAPPSFTPLVLVRSHESFFGLRGSVPRMTSAYI